LTDFRGNTVKSKTIIDVVEESDASERDEPLLLAEIDIQIPDKSP